jgi:uncharacterized protein (TIGR00369 family)
VEGSGVDGRELVRAFLEHSPFSVLLGIRVRELGEGEATLEMPFDERLATAGQTIHGGAISTLLDTAATAASWATQFERAPTKWGTASLTVNFVRPAQGRDLVAEARVVRRGRAMCHCTIEASDADGCVATGTALYALS